MINTICTGKKAMWKAVFKKQVCGPKICTKLGLFSFLVPSLFFPLFFPYLLQRVLRDSLKLKECWHFLLTLGDFIVIHITSVLISGNLII